MSWISVDAGFLALTPFPSQVEPEATMQSISFSSLARLLAKPVVAVFLCAPTWVMAQVPGTTFAGPSIVRSAETAEFSGVGFAPGSVVGIGVTAPGRKEVYYRAIVAPDGTLKYWISPHGMGGVHVVKVMDDQGRTLASVNFTAMK